MVGLLTWEVGKSKTMRLASNRNDPLLIRAARNLGASDFAIMREVILPGALPGIISGLKVTLAISWSCVSAMAESTRRNSSRSCCAASLRP